jgi:predicted PhzF superfamily epimerase YddE/YHI9
MDFPAFTPEPCTPEPGLVAAMGVRPREVLSAWAYLLVYETEAQVRALAPDMDALAKIERDGVIATAPADGSGSANGVDFVSRYFVPSAGIPEDPVTGSTHCILTPYWAARLGRTTLEARQVSARGGAMTCRLLGDRVELAGACVLYLQGEIELPPPEQISETAPR